MLCQLLRRQGRAEVGIPLAHDRQRQGANLSGEPMVAGFAPVLGKQARRTVLLEAAQQTKHLAPLQPNQHTGVTDTQTTRLNPQQHVKPAEFLLAHRHHRHGAPPGTPEPGGVSPLLCRGVSSLYCSYMRKPHNLPYVKCRSPFPKALATISRFSSSRRGCTSRSEAHQPAAVL